MIFELKNKVIFYLSFVSSVDIILYKIVIIHSLLICIELDN